MGLFTSCPLRTACTLSCLGLLLVLGVGGCGGGDEGNSVSGTVKLGGQALTGGTVTFIGQEGDKTPMTSIIQGNGYYSIPRAPLGKVKITVHGTGASSGGSTKTPPVVLPAKYAKADTSDLTYTVTKGTQRHDIELTP